MVTRFVADTLGVRNVKPELCERLVREASAILRTEYPKLTPSLLDHAIWKYQRAQEETAPTACCRPPGNDQPSESKLGSNLGPDADQRPGILSTVEKYSPSTNTWTTVASMPTARGGLAAAADTQGNIYAIGGINGSNAYLSTVEEHSPRLTRACYK